MPDSILANFKVRGPQDHAAMLRYLLALAGEEGDGRKLAFESSVNQRVGELDPAEAPETLAAQCAQACIDRFTVPLRDHSASGDLDEGVRLQSTSTSWIAAQEKRWRTAGGPPDGVTYACRTAIRSKRFTTPDGLRPMVGWLLETAGPGPIELLHYDGQGIPKLATLPPGTPDETCARLLGIAPADRVGRLTATRARREASVTPPYNPSAFVKAPDLEGLLDRLKAWREIDVD